MTITQLPFYAMQKCYMHLMIRPMPAAVPEVPIQHKCATFSDETGRVKEAESNRDDKKLFIMSPSLLGLAWRPLHQMQRLRMLWRLQPHCCQRR